MKKSHVIILIFTVFLSIAIILLVLWNNNLRKEESLQECKNKAEDFCKKYGIVDYDVNISYSQQYCDYDEYLLKITGTYTDVSMENLYQLVKSIDSIIVNYNDTFMLARITLNNKVYSLDVSNKNELFCNGVVVYTYVSDKDKQIIDMMKDKFPYVGMREKYLDYTRLGKADSVEKCLDFNALDTRAKSKTYEWDATNEHGWYKITVEYRMHRSHRFDDYLDLPLDDGYVSEISYLDENNMIQFRDYVDTLK